MDVKSPLALVLSAGGARAAYQVGVIRHLAEYCPSFLPKIYVGVSAGSINAIHFAQGGPLQELSQRLFQIWSQLKFDQVFETNLKSTFQVGLHIINDLYLSKFTKKLLFSSVLDATPLAMTLRTHADFVKIWKAIRRGDVSALAVTATNYQDGTTTTFYDSFKPIAAWHKAKRKAIPTPIRIKHVMASCSIPILFEPIKIEGEFYGDGSIHSSFPLSPAIHLGAEKILTVSVSPIREQPIADIDSDQLSLGVVAGAVLNSIFNESLENDIEMLTRFNELAKAGAPCKHIDSFVIRPSQDPGFVATHFVKETPFYFRQLLQTASVKSIELGDLMSYLLFSPGYIQALLELGKKDAEKNHDAIEQWLKQ